VPDSIAIHRAIAQAAQMVASKNIGRNPRLSTAGPRHSRIWVAVDLGIVTFQRFSCSEEAHAIHMTSQADAFALTVGCQVGPLCASTAPVSKRLVISPLLIFSSIGAGSR
jgi:hypothetical protein